MKRILKFLTTVLLILIVVSLAATVVLRYFLPKEQIRTVITKELSSRLNQDITMGDFSVGFRPDLEFVAYDMRIVDPLTSQETLAARRVWFNLNVRELFNLRNVINDITFDSAVLNLVRDAHGAWNVEKIIENIRSTKQTDATHPVSWLEFGQIFINSSSIGIDDKLTGQQLRVNGLTATVDVRKEILHIESASLSLPPVEADLSGTVSEFFKPGPVLDMSATLRVTSDGPIAGMLPVDFPKGETIADVSLDASGRIAEIMLKTTFSFNPLVTAAIPIKGTMAGILRVKEGSFEADDLNLSFGKSTLSLSGTCSNILQKERAVSLKGTASIALEEALALTGKDLIAALEPKGSADATIALNGSMAQIDLETTINLLNAGLTIPQVMQKKEGTPSTLVVDARYSVPDELVIDSFDLVIDGARLSGNVQVKPGNEPWLKTSINTLDFPLKSLNLLPAIRFDEGTVMLSAEVWQANQAQEGMDYRGAATVGQATLTVDAMNEPLRDLDARIEIAGQNADLHSASFAMRESRYQLQANVSDFSDPLITGQLYTDALDIKQIVDAFANQKTGAKKAASSNTSTRPSFSIEILVEADAMCAGNFRTGAASTIWHTSGRIQEFDAIAIDAYRGNLSGGFYLALLENDTYWVTDVSGHNMDLEVVFEQLLEETIKSDAKKGLLSMEGTLSGVASREREVVWKSLEGELKVRVIDGAIKQSPLLNSVLLATQLPVRTLFTSKVASLNSLLETVKTKGRNLLDNPVIYKKIEGTFQIDTGVAHTEDLHFEGETVDMLFKGDLNLVKEQIDMKIRVAPIGLIGSVLRKVPVAGTGMDKAKESIFSLMFTASGPLYEPKVQLDMVDKLTPKKKKE